jgi:hypothetical protein
MFDGQIVGDKNEKVDEQKPKLDRVYTIGRRAALSPDLLKLLDAAPQKEIDPLVKVPEYVMKVARYFMEPANADDESRIELEADIRSKYNFSLDAHGRFAGKADFLVWSMANAEQRIWRYVGFCTREAYLFLKSASVVWRMAGFLLAAYAFFQQCC